MPRMMGAFLGFGESSDGEGGGRSKATRFFSDDGVAERDGDEAREREDLRTGVGAGGVAGPAEVETMEAVEGAGSELDGRLCLPFERKPAAKPPNALDDCAAFGIAEGAGTDATSLGVASGTAVLAATAASPAVSPDAAELACASALSSASSSSRMALMSSFGRTGNGLLSSAGGAGDSEGPVGRGAGGDEDDGAEEVEDEEVLAPAGALTVPAETIVVSEDAVSG